MKIKSRKNDHIKICLTENVSSYNINTSFDNYTLSHNALPEIDFNNIDLSTTFLKKQIKAPILISAITGGSKLAKKINTNLALAAQKLGIAMGVGSIKIALENPETLFSFQLREVAPDIPLLSNLGAVELNYGYTEKECKEAIEKINADALVLHLNPLQEAIQPEGNTNFKSLIPKIKALKKKLPYPLILKEVGSGFSADLSKKLKKLKLDYIDSAGKGGTSFAAIEGTRSGTTVGETFREWGVSTTDSIINLKKSKTKIIASGGIRNGVDAAKAIALGAGMVGIALPLLQAANISEEAVTNTLKQFIKELKIAMFCIGAKNICELKKIQIKKVEY